MLLFRMQARRLLHAEARDLVMDAWGGLPQLKGFPVVEVCVHEKARNWEAQPAATGMIRVTRQAIMMGGRQRDGAGSAPMPGL